MLQQQPLRPKTRPGGRVSFIVVYESHFATGNDYLIFLCVLIVRLVFWIVFGTTVDCLTVVVVVLVVAVVNIYTCRSS